MAHFSFKKDPDGSIKVWVKKSTGNFTLKVTQQGYWQPNDAELKGALRLEKDFFDAKGEMIEKVNKHLNSRVQVLVGYLIEDLSKNVTAKNINVEKIKTMANNALYRTWFGKEKDKACFFYLSQFPKEKMYRYRTSSSEINFGSLLTSKDWYKLKEMISIAEGKCEVIPVTDKHEKAAALNAFFYSLALKKIKEDSIEDYKRSARKRQEVK